MNTKPTSGERIEEFMSHAKSNPVLCWITAWRVQIDGVWTWRVTLEHEANDLTRRVDVWKSLFYFSGKEFVVHFFSAHDEFSLDEALAICDCVVKGRTIKQELILE